MTQPFAQRVEKAGTRPLLRPHRGGVGRGHLSVHETKAPRADLLHETYHCDLRRIGAQREHRFPEEDAPEGHAVEPSHELPALPSFDRVCVAQAVESDVSALHFGRDPRAVLARTWGGLARADDALEGRVERQLVGLAAQDATQ